MKKLLIPLIAFILFSSLAIADLSCEGGGQAFMIPEYIKTETISIPCVINVVSAPFNASCVGSITYEESLISVYPPPTSIDHIGLISHIAVESSSTSDVFVMEFSNRDFFHKGTFGWEVFCKDSSEVTYIDSGTFVVEYPFTEGLTVNTMVIFQRDSDKFWALFFMIIFILILITVAIYLSGLKR